MNANYRFNDLKVIAIAEAFGELDPPSSERKYWVHRINQDNLMIFLKTWCYPDTFFEYYRMSIESFDELLNKIRPKITKQITTFRQPISVEQRLTIMLR